MKTRIRSSPELRVLTVLFLNNGRAFTAREMSIKAKVNQSKIYGIFKQLEKAREISHYYHKGTNGRLIKYYMLTEDVGI